MSLTLRHEKAKIWEMEPQTGSLEVGGGRGGAVFHKDRLLKSQKPVPVLRLVKIA